MKSLLAIWNLDFSDRTKRRSNIRREIRQRLTCKQAGKGNKANKRYRSMCQGELHLIGNIYIN